MERTDNDRPASTTPKLLIAVAAVLLIARIADTALTLQKADASTLTPAIHWRSIQSGAGHAVAKAPPKPPEQDLPPYAVKTLDKLFSGSRAEKKIVLYEFYADWSDPCKAMESTSLTNAQVAPFVDANFVPVRITDRQHEDGTNSALASYLQKRYRIFAFPTLVAVGYDGEPIATLVGNCSSLTTYRFLTRSLATFPAERRL